MQESVKEVLGALLRGVCAFEMYLKDGVLMFGKSALIDAYIIPT